MSRTTSLGSSFRPQLEGLDERALCSVGLGGTTLYIDGTNGEDTHVVRYVNNRSAIVVDVQESGSFPRTTPPIPASWVAKIVYQGFGGNDYYENSTNMPEDANGGSGNDRLWGSLAHTRLTGGPGVDQLYGRGSSTNWMWGDSDTDYISFSNINTGRPTNAPTGGSQKNEIGGGGGGDVIHGSDAHDVIDGQGGNDTINGYGGNDTLRGGGHDDAIDGGAGNDLLHGDDGADTLFGGLHDDALYGGIGNDFLHGGKGSNYLFGEDGDDDLYGSLPGPNETYDGAPDIMWGGPGRDTFRGRVAQDRIADYFPGNSTYPGDIIR